MVDGRRVGSRLDALRTHPAARRVLSVISIVLLLAGVGMFSYPFVTDVYTDQVLQERLSEEFADAAEQLAAGEQGPGSVEEWKSGLTEGAALTRMVIPKLGVDTIVVEGTSPAALRAGAGHYPRTPLPGQAGNVGIAGHRTTYGKPLSRADELGPGDEVWLLTPVGDYRYVLPPPERVEGRGDNPFITHAADWSVVDPTAEPTLTLTTCHPKGSARQRLIVRGVLAEALPPGGYAASGNAAGT